MAISIRPVVALLLLCVLAVSAVPAPAVTPVAEVAKRSGFAPAVITPRPWKREEDEKRDLIGDLADALDGDSSPEAAPGYHPGGAHADVATPRGWKRAGFQEDLATGRGWKRGGFQEDVATPRGWKRAGFQEDLATPRGWVKEKREEEYLAEAEDVEKRAANIINPRPWKKDAMPTPRPFVA